ncbi:hypothetical protein HDU98_001667, partial [Podochytrium sp. JEL0797]
MYVNSMQSEDLTPPTSRNGSDDELQHAAETIAKLASSGELHPAMTTEDKARAALMHIIMHSGSLDSYVLHRVVGFGANGVVLAAERLKSNGAFEAVAIKIIFKSSSAKQKLSDSLPNEIKILRAMAADPHPGLLRYIADFQDKHNYYL